MHNNFVTNSSATLWVRRSCCSFVICIFWTAFISYAVLVLSGGSAKLWPLVSCDSVGPGARWKMTCFLSCSFFCCPPDEKHVENVSSKGSLIGIGRILVAFSSPSIIASLEWSKTIPQTRRLNRITRRIIGCTDKTDIAKTWKIRKEWTKVLGEFWPLHSKRLWKSKDASY